MKKAQQLKKNEETAISIPTNAQEVPKVIEQLKAQLAILKGDVEEKVSLDILYNYKNIKDIDTVKELMEISASINARESAYNEAIIRHNLQNANIQPFSQEGKSLEEWNKIIDKASRELINKVQIKNLEDAIAGLSEHLDAETKLKMKLASLVDGASQYVK